MENNDIINYGIRNPDKPNKSSHLTVKDFFQTFFPLFVALSVQADSLPQTWDTPLQKPQKKLLPPLQRRPDHLQWPVPRKRWEFSLP